MYQLPTATCEVNYWTIPMMLRKEVNGEILITAQDVIDATLRVFDITKPTLVSKSRKTEIVRARDICMYVMRLKVKVLNKKKRLVSIPFKQIGRLFNRDHSTALSGIGHIEDDLSVAAYRQETNEQIRSVIELL